MKVLWHGLLVVVGVTAAASVWAQATPVGGEFQVNSYTTGYQGLPKACRAQGGGFVVIWRSDFQDGASSGIFGQRYDGAGVTLGTEFQVNTYTTNSQAFPALACNAAGDFVVVWRSVGQDGDNSGIFGQRYTSAGAAQGTEFQVNTYTTGSQDNPGVSADVSGNFVVVWTSAGQDGDNSGVFGQRYTSAGAAQGTEFQVNVYTTGSQSTTLSTPVAADGSFNFVVAWTSDGQDGDLTGIFGRRFSSSGAPVGSDFQVNTYTTSRQENPAVTAAGTGAFVIVWRSFGQDGDNYGVFGQRYTSAGAAQGTEFLVNTYTTGSQSFATVAANATGDFVVAWAGDGQDGDSSGIFGQQFDAGGSASGTEFQVNTTTTGFQSLESVAADAQGNFVVTWLSGSNQDGDGFGVFAQRFKAALCAPAPRMGCRGGPALKPMFFMKEYLVSSRRKMKWKWLRGAQTDPVDLGDPINSTEYALCVYDSSAGVPALTTRFEIPPSIALWKANTKGFKYKDDSAAQDGVFKITLKADQNGKAKMVMKGSGLNLPLPLPVSLTQFLNQDTTVTVQLVNSLGECWTSDFTAPASKNTAELFRDKEG